MQVIYAIPLALHIERERRPSVDTTSTFRLISSPLQTFKAQMRQSLAATAERLRQRGVVIGEADQRRSNASRADSPRQRGYRGNRHTKDGFYRVMAGRRPASERRRRNIAKGVATREFVCGKSAAAVSDCRQKKHARSLQAETSASRFPQLWFCSHCAAARLSRRVPAERWPQLRPPRP